jgi:flagellar hook-length control protein FliK
MPISNLATAGLPPQALLKTSGVSPATSASGPTAFAQVVGEVLNRHVSSSIAQPIAPSRGNAVPKTAARAGNAPRSGKDQSQSAESANAASPLTVIFLPNLVMPLQLPSLDKLTLPDVAVSGTPAMSGGMAREVAAGVAAVGSATGGNGAGTTAPAPSPDPKGAGLAHDIGRALAQQAAAELAAAASPPALPTTASAAAPGAPRPSNGAPTADEKVTASPQPTSSASSAPAVIPQTKVVPPPVLAPAVAPAQPLASLLPQIPQLQDGSAGAHSTFANPAAQSAPNTQPDQGNGLTHAPLQFTGVGPTVVSALTTAPKEMPPVIDASQANAPVGTSSSAQYAASQNTGSNHKEPGRADAPASADAPSTASAAREATSFSVALDAASVKQDVSPALTPPAVGPGAPSASPERGVSSPGGLVHSAPAPDPSSPPAFPGMEAAASRIVNNAQLVQAAGHSEMRIAMDSDKLGAVELRARMIGDVVGAAITVEKREAHAVLAVELPALQQALSDKQLRIEQVTLLHGSFSATTGDAGASTRQEERSAPQATMTPWPANGTGAPSIFTSAEQSNIFNAQGRLSVHA